MKTVYQLLEFLLCSSACQRQNKLYVVGFLYMQTISMCSAVFADSRDKDEMEIFMRKKMICEVLSEENIVNRIHLLERDLGHLYNKETKAKICWNSIFTVEGEREIICFCRNNKIENDFVVILGVILDELFYVMCTCNSYGLETEFYSIEMCNIIHFLREICMRHFLEFQYTIMKIITEFLHAHFLAALVFKHEVPKNKLETIIARIKKHDKKLRKLILPMCKSNLMLNNIFQEMPDLDLPQRDLDIYTTTRFFINGHIINCHECMIQDTENTVIRINLPEFFFFTLDEAVDMEDIYVTLENLKNNWKSEHYTSYETTCAMYMYLVVFSYRYCGDMSAFVTSLCSHTRYMRCLDLIKSKNNTRLSSFLIGLLPVGFTGVLVKCHPDHLSISVRICYEKILKIVDYMKHLHKENVNEKIMNFFSLNHDEKLNSIKAVLICYNTYLAFISNEVKANKGLVTTDFETLNDICRIISHHFDNLDGIAFWNSIEKYIELLRALQKFANSTIRCVQEGEIGVFPSYHNDFLDFYENYHETGLHIGCIYDIRLLLGPPSRDTGAWLYPLMHSNMKATQFYNASRVYIKYLQTRSYVTFMRNEEIYSILDHIMRCLGEIKKENYNNVLPHCSLIHNRSGYIIQQDMNKCDMKFYLDVIENNFWSKIHLYTNLFDPLRVDVAANYSIKNMYVANCITETNIKRLYHGLYRFIDQKKNKYLGLLKFGVINRKNKKIVDEVLSDIVFDAFLHIKNTKGRCNDVYRMVGMTHCLMRSLNFSYSVDLRVKIVLQYKLTESGYIRDAILSVVKVLGIYILFEEIITHYSVILRHRIMIMSHISNNVDVGRIERHTYELLITYCRNIDHNIQESIEKPDRSFLYNFGAQLIITYGAIKTSDNDFVIASELFKFIVNISSLESLYTFDDVSSVIEHIIATLQLRLLTCTNNNSVQYTRSQCKMFLYCIEYIIRNLGMFMLVPLNAFINLCCTVIVDVSKDVEISGILGNLETVSYDILIDMFLELNESVNDIKKWETVCSMIYLRTFDLSIVGTAGKFVNLLLIISSILDNNSVGDNDHSAFISKSYHILKIFLIEIERLYKEHPTTYDHLFDNLCLLLQNDLRMCESLGYKIVTESFEDIECYICRSSIVLLPMKPLNCVCKSYMSDINCLLRYNLSKCDDGDITRFNNICCICRN